MSYPPRASIPGLPVAPVSQASKDLVDAILRVKRAPLCVICGNVKEPGRWFDKTCYFSLPPAMRSKLWTVHQYTDHELRDNFLASTNHLITHAKRFVPRQKMPLEAQQIIAEMRFSEALTAYLVQGGRA